MGYYKNCPILIGILYALMVEFGSSLGIKMPLRPKIGIPIVPPLSSSHSSQALALEAGTCTLSEDEKNLFLKPPHIMCGGEKMISTLNYPPEYEIKISAHHCNFEPDKSKFTAGTVAFHMGVNQCGTKLVEDVYQNEARFYVYKNHKMVKSFNFTLNCPQSRVFVMPKVPEVLKKPMHQVEVQTYFGGETGLDFIFDFQRSYSGTIYFGNRKTLECMRTFDCGGQVFAGQVPVNCGFERVNDLLVGDVYMGNPEDPNTGHFKVSCIAL